MAWRQRKERRVRAVLLLSLRVLVVGTCCCPLECVPVAGCASSAPGPGPRCSPSVPGNGTAMWTRLLSAAPPEGGPTPASVGAKISPWEE